MTCQKDKTPCVNGAISLYVNSAGVEGELCSIKLNKIYSTIINTEKSVEIMLPSHIFFIMSLTH